MNVIDRAAEVVRAAIAYGLGDRGDDVAVALHRAGLLIPRRLLRLWAPGDVGTRRRHHRLPRLPQRQRSGRVEADMRPRLLDLFAGAGGAAMGYHRAGFDVVGVDINPQPNYPFEFYQGNAMAWLSDPWVLEGYDVIHASPPCQAYSVATPDRSAHPDLYEPTRSALIATGLPWVIENVIGSPYRSGVVLCGSMFGLRVRRHRNFESSHLLFPPTPCRHKEQGEVLGVYGDGGGGKSTRPSGGGGTKAHRREFGELMGMPWATPREIVLAVPPLYTEHIGTQLLTHVEAAA